MATQWYGYTTRAKLYADRLEIHIDTWEPNIPLYALRYKEFGGIRCIVQDIPIIPNEVEDDTDNSLPPEHRHYYNYDDPTRQNDTPLKHRLDSLRNVPNEHCNTEKAHQHGEEFVWVWVCIWGTKAHRTEKTARFPAHTDPKAYNPHIANVQTTSSVLVLDKIIIHRPTNPLHYLAQTSPQLSQILGAKTQDAAIPKSTELPRVE